jgi:type IV pilus assembly protein PilA
MSKLKVAYLLFSLLLLYFGAEVAYEGWKNPKPTRMTVADYVKSDKSKEWVVLTDAKINLLNAVTVTTTTSTTNRKTHELVSSKTALSKLYIPIESTGSTQNDTVSLLLETDNEEILNIARQMDAMSGAKLLEFVVRERDKLIRSVELSGLMKREEGGEIRTHIKNLASNFYILKHNESVPGLTGGLIIMGIGLLPFIFIFLRWKKEAYEKLSKPKTRAAYNSQGQAAKSPIPHSPSIIIPPQRENVVVEQKLAPPPDRDKSQVSPHRPPPDYYKILGVSHAADLQKIKQAAQTKANEIKMAFTVLSHAETRLAHNANLSYAETRTAYDAKLNPGPHNHYDTLAVSREANLAQIEVANQARMNEIKEAYENLSKPETRATYDSQWQPVKPSTPVAPSPPKRENVVVEQKPVSSPDRDKSQVSPHRLPPDYYKILGISHSADLEEIKRAVKTKGNNIKTAFTVLSHADQRTTYDAKPNLGPHNHYATLLVKKLASTAMIKAAAQARMNEIKEVYENLSKPETRATYDSQWQPVKPSTPVAPSPPKRENVVVEQKPVSPPDRDKSQVPPQPSSNVSLTDATRHTTEIKRAKSGTRLSAVMVDAFTVVVPIIFWVFFSSFPVQKLVSGEMADIYVRLSVLILIGVLMTNLVLLYHHGQTLGRRLLAIKIVDADGSRAELSRILCEFWSVKLLFIMLYPVIVVMMLIIMLILPIGLIAAFVMVLIPLFFGLILRVINLPRLAEGLSRLVTASLASIPLTARFVLYVIQNPLCLHQNFVHTIEVRVSPGNNDTPYGSLTGVIGTSTLMAVMFCLAAWGMINAHTDFLKRSKVSEAIELLGGLKTPAEKYLATKGEFPPAIDLLTKKTSGKYIASLVSNPKEFYFEASMSWDDRILAGKTVRLIYQPDTKTWSCSAAYPNGIPEKYLPSTCKK